MNSFPARALAIVLLIGLAAYVCLKGVLPALSRIDTDFPNYFTAARIVADGGDTSRLYDDSWFLGQIRHYGMDSNGKFAPFPPPTALLLVPIVRLTPLNALRVVTAINVLCLLCSIFLLARILSWNLVNAAVFVLLSGHAITSGLRFGQPYIIVSATCILGYYAYVNGRRVLAGALWGLFVPIKYFPVIMLAYFSIRREWRILAGGAAVIAAIAALSIGVLGWDIHRIFLLSVFENHLVGHLSLQDHIPPVSAAYQSFDTLFNRLFVLDPVANPRPLLAAPVLKTFALVTTKAAIALAALAALLHLARARPADAVAPSLGVLGVLLLLIAPANATYYMVLLWLPLALLMDYCLRQGARARACLLLSAYALIGFFPYRFTNPFEGHGGLNVLAYPRLLLLLVIFVAATYGLVFRERPPADRRSSLATAERTGSLSSE
jgi:hypothetical protein